MPKPIVETLITIGRRARIEGGGGGGEKKVVTAPLPRPLNPHAGFPTDFCVIILDVLTMENSSNFILTAAAIVQMEARSGMVRFSGAWKVLQKMYPSEAARHFDVSTHDALAVVKEYEKRTGYYFVDKSTETRTLSTVRRAATGVIHECGCGWVSDQPASVTRLLGSECSKEFEKVLEGGSERFVRTQDILADAYTFASHLRPFVFKSAIATK